MEQLESIPKKIQEMTEITIQQNKCKNNLFWESYKGNFAPVSKPSQDTFYQMILTSVGTHKLVYFTSGPCYVLCAMNAFCQWNVFRKFPFDYASIWRTITESCFHPLGAYWDCCYDPPPPLSWTHSLICDPLSVLAYWIGFPKFWLMKS